MYNIDNDNKWYLKFPSWHELVYNFLHTDTKQNLNYTARLVKYFPQHKLAMTLVSLYRCSKLTFPKCVHILQAFVNLAYRTDIWHQNKNKISYVKKSNISYLVQRMYHIKLNQYKTQHHTINTVTNSALVVLFIHNSYNSELPFQTFGHVLVVPHHWSYNN